MRTNFIIRAVFAAAFGALIVGAGLSPFTWQFWAVIIFANVWVVVERAIK